MTVVAKDKTSCLEQIMKLNDFKTFIKKHIINNDKLKDSNLRPKLLMLNKEFENDAYELVLSFSPKYLTNKDIISNLNIAYQSILTDYLEEKEFKKYKVDVNYEIPPSTTQVIFREKVKELYNKYISE